MFDQLHQDHFKVVLHVAYPTGIREMHGAAKDACDPKQRAETQSSCYWDMHRPAAEDRRGRLVARRRRRAEYALAAGAQSHVLGGVADRPAERAARSRFTATATRGCSGTAAFLWSGDVNSQWETLRNHVPIAVNTGLTGIPYWGTDIGGFVPTRELTGELYVRWFQFAAFNTLCRSHGRTWMLRLPWGWNTGETGPVETPNVPLDPKELHNAQVEPICRKYLELRYRMMPYLYSAVRECTQTGMPVMRALWLHYPDDAKAVARGDQYLWGRDVLVAPVVEQGATARKRVSAARRLVRLLDRRAPGRRPRNHSPGRPGDDFRSTCAPARSCRWVR